jgi:hypothetical protein
MIGWLGAWLANTLFGACLGRTAHEAAMDRWAHLLADARAEASARTSAAAVCLGADMRALQRRVAADHAAADLLADATAIARRSVAGHDDLLAVAAVDEAAEALALARTCLAPLLHRHPPLPQPMDADVGSARPGAGTTPVLTLNAEASDAIFELWVRVTLIGEVSAAARATCTRIRDEMRALGMGQDAEADDGITDGGATTDDDIAALAANLLEDLRKRTVEEVMASYAATTK